MDVKNWLAESLATLGRTPGVDYADARYLERKSESITVRNEEVAGLASRESRGYGIRVLYKGCLLYTSPSPRD